MWLVIPASIQHFFKVRFAAQQCKLCGIACAHVPAIAIKLKLPFQTTSIVIRIAQKAYFSILPSNIVFETTLVC